jgi:hypothetical protein
MGGCGHACSERAAVRCDALRCGESSASAQIDRRRECAAEDRRAVHDELQTQCAMADGTPTTASDAHKPNKTPTIKTAAKHNSDEQNTDKQNSAK